MKSKRHMKKQMLFIHVFFLSHYIDTILFVFAIRKDSPFIDKILTIQGVYQFSATMQFKAVDYPNSSPQSNF